MFVCNRLCGISNLFVFHLHIEPAIGGVGGQGEIERERGSEKKKGMQCELCARHSSELSFNRFNGKRDRPRRTAVAK